MLAACALLAVVAVSQEPVEPEKPATLEERLALVEASHDALAERLDRLESAWLGARPGTGEKSARSRLDAIASDDLERRLARLENRVGPTADAARLESRLSRLESDLRRLQSDVRALRR